MKRSELKNIIKPIVRECIAEALVEEGLLYTVVSEVAKGMSSVIVESAPVAAPVHENTAAIQEAEERRLQQAKESRKKLLDAIGNDSYGGVDLFEGTRAAAPDMSPHAQAVNPLANVDPGDAGINIDSFFAGNARRWNALK